MSRCGKIWLAVATALVVIGFVIFVGALALVKFDFVRLSTQKYRADSYEFNGDFENISINADTAAVTFVPSNDDSCRVECLAEEKLRYSAEIRDNTLIIDTVDNRKWYDYIGISLQSPEITVYLPREVYTSLCIKTQTGNVEISDRYSFQTVAITASTSNIDCRAQVSKSIEIGTQTGRIAVGSTQPDIIKVSASTGSITLNDVTCNKLTAESSTGRIQLKNVISNGSITVRNTTGGVKFDGCDADDITVRTSTGSVRGTLLSKKTFVTDTSTGRVRVPKSATGGRCEITTSTGNIEIEIE